MNAANNPLVKLDSALTEGNPVEQAERGERSDVRRAKSGVVRTVVGRPGFGAVAGIILVFLFFAIGTRSFTEPGAVSTWLAPSSLIGLSAIPVALLMIGGEFDLSAGVMIGSTSLVTGLLCTKLNWNIWPALLVSLVFAVGIGLFNGLLVSRTGLPSFIVTLGSFFILQGLNTGITQLLTGNVLVTGVNLAPGFSVLKDITGSSFTVDGVAIQISIVWWIVFTAIGAVILSRTAIGNWIMSVGGDAAASRGMGVPVGRVKVGLFTASSVTAWFVGCITISQLGTVTTNQGVGQELVFIIAAVVGGCLLTGGYGSVIGASAAALIFGMVQVGIFYKGWNSTFYYAFLGAVLLLAVIVNIIIRKRLEVSR